ncbi:MAG TPA: FtsX-like permease family protein, partial [Bacteroidetes bacterium]|nr:FtsX-like permease family protein [Bacteroidota bacterium]
RKSLLKIPGVDSVKFVSKYDALQKFQKEFGENIIDILGENPLQSSFRIRLKKSFHTRVRVQKIMGQIKKLSGVEDVTYRYDLLKIIEKYLKIFFGIGISLGAIIAFISLLLISNTVRMAIVSRSEEIKVMRLLGATPQFIRRPFLVQGFYLGVFGGILSLFLLLVVIWAARHELSLQILNAREIFGFVMGWGIILGVLGSWRAIGKYLKEEI